MDDLRDEVRRYTDISTGVISDDDLGKLVQQIVERRGKQPRIVAQIAAEVLVVLRGPVGKLGAGTEKKGRPR